MAYSTVRMPLMVSTAFICPVELTDVQACWLFVCWASSFHSCAQCYGMLWFDVPTALLRVQRPCIVPGEGFFCSFRQEPRPWQSRTRRMNEALTTGVP